MTTEATETTVDQLAVMAERMARLEELLTSQRAEIARLHAATAPLPAPHTVVVPEFPALPVMPVATASIEAPPTEEKPKGRASRRTLLKLGGAAAAAGVAAAVAGTGTAQAHSNAATFQQSATGFGNVAIEGDGTTAAVGVTGTSDNASGEFGPSTNAVGVYGSSANYIGVKGYTPAASGYGIWGSNDPGIGVYGSSTGNVGVSGYSANYVGVQGQGNGSNGVGGWFTGGRAALALGAGSVPGAPTSGGHFAGDVYLDSTLTIWVCTTSGTPGWWTRLVRAPSGGNLVETASGSGNVAIEGDGTSGAYGVKGTSDTNYGVTGQSTSSYGVYGTSGSGAGVYGYSAGSYGVEGFSVNGVGARGYSTNSVGMMGYSQGYHGVDGISLPNYGGWFHGPLAQIFLDPGGTAGAPTSGTHSVGEMYLGSGGTVWVCTANGAPGTWVRQTGVQSGVTGGALNYLAAPIRIFDSRVGQPAPLPTTKAPLASGTTYTIQVTGVFGNLTVTNTQGGGDLILWPHGASQPLTSNINYSGGMTIANAVNVGLSTDGKIDLYVHVSGTDVIFDVAGYVL
jgi:hypothetical protein